MKVKYFMWGFQPYFLLSARHLFDGLCKLIGCDLKPSLFLVGLAAYLIYMLLGGSPPPLTAMPISLRIGLFSLGGATAALLLSAAIVGLAPLSPQAARLADRFWPGPLTLVLPLKEGPSVHPLVSAGLGTVALRMPGGFAHDLIAAFGRPLAPSWRQGRRMNSRWCGCTSPSRWGGSPSARWIC